MLLISDQVAKKKPTFGSQELFAILMELEEDQKGQSIHIPPVHRYKPIKEKLSKRVERTESWEPRKRQI